ncbi:hypothetical protein, partial [uncultured Microbacterium sp.]|uniref:hypothetical protein n=1 Tax=uncultured Microbacterium sp. TaxID=191216 RepID=UPI0025D4779F
MTSGSDRYQHVIVRGAVSDADRVPLDPTRAAQVGELRISGDWFQQSRVSGVDGAAIADLSV